MRILVLTMWILGGSSMAQWCPPQPLPMDVHVLLDSVEGTVPELPDLARTLQGQELLSLLENEVAFDQIWPILQAVYDLKPTTALDIATASGSQRDEFVATLASTLASTIDSYAVLVRDQPSNEWLAIGMYTSSPLLERLRVVRLPESARSAQRETLLTLLATCHHRADTWIEVPAESLSTVLQQQHDGFMLTSVRTYASTNEVRWVPLPGFLDAISFRHPATRDATAFSAWFTSTSLSFFDIAPLLTSVNSNVEGRELFQALGELFR